MAEVGMTAQLFTERLNRMLSAPDTGLIKSQGTPRPRGPKCCLGYGRCLLEFICQIKEILQHSKRDGQSLTASLVSQKEEERHQRNEQLKKQTPEWTCSRPCHVSHRLRLHATHLR
ncbi:hypothetical protein RRG08_033147 [Elysia crispata]|uniref:Uncharacterized protein n=1 Tax=Elysia crispata TaxID=231223 RepID=A0AAE0YEA0_9GAST|nr:hypothetical protein RRG08_033147 [Elysia crispata]